MKIPVPVLILLVVTTVYLAIQRKNLDAEWLMILAISFFLLFFSYFDRSTGRLRYVLPIFPFVFLLIARLFSVEFKRPILAKALLLGLSIWYLVAAFTIYPDYLAYFNEVVGGPRNGYKLLADSNIDWGQDLKALKRYMDENDISKVKLAYFGSADANYYGIDYDYLPSVGLEPTEEGQQWWYELNATSDEELGPQLGSIAVGANILASPGWMNPLFYENYQWLREHEPVDQVGYSILIYEIH